MLTSRPLADPEPYLHDASPRAAPKCISGRTSYLHVRLEFLHYPQVIPQFCNTGGCEPRRTVTSASLCSWIAHVVSGRIAATARPLRTRLPSGSPALALVNRATCDALAGSFYKRHAISPWYLKDTVTSDCLGVRGFRVSFIPLAGCFSPFPHGTSSLSVAECV